MAIAVVIVLEVIDVTHDQRQRQLAASGEGKVLVYREIEMAAITQTRQLIDE